MEGKCPICGRFRKLKCPHNVTASQFFIDFSFEGERIVRGTNLDSETLRTFKDATVLLAQAQDEIKKGIFNPVKWKSKLKLDFSCGTLLQKWYKDKERELEQGKLAPGYICKLKSYINNYYLPGLNLQDVRRLFNLKDFALSLPKTLSLKYQSNILKALECFFRWCKENRYITELPVFARIEIPDYEPVTIDRNTQLKLLELIPAEHKPIFTFLFYQGARPGEVRALKWDCIKDDIVTYRRTFSKEILIEHTKNRKIRKNLIFPEALEMLPNRGFPLDFIFRHGKQIKRHYSRTFLQSIFNKALDAFNAKYETDLKVKLYESTKHSFGTQLINEGVPEEILRKWFGHSSLKMTEKYARLKTVEAFRKNLMRL